MLGLFVFIVVTWIWAAMAADRRLMRIIQKVQRRVDELQARDARRPVLRGEARPGNGWEDYGQAAAELKPVKEAQSLQQLLSKSPKIDPALGDRLLAEHGVALDHLQRGAARAASSSSSDHNRNMSGHNYVSALAQLKSRALLKESRIKDCLDLLLDLCQFGRDLASTGPAFWETLGTMYMRGAWDEMHGVMGSGKATKSELEELDRGLATLDQIYPSHGEALERDVLIFAQELIPTCESGIAWGRLLNIGFLEYHMEVASRVAQAEPGGWSELQRVAREVEEEVSRSWNPLMKSSGTVFVQNLDQNRAARARLRLLRLEVHWRATGELLDLEDPFGGRLKHVVKDGALKAWSLGKDGVDDGGDGEWAKSGKDIVLEIIR